MGFRRPHGSVTQSPSAHHRLPCLRLKGSYFAIRWLALNEVVRALVSYFDSLHRRRLPHTLPPSSSLWPLYYAMGGVALTGALISYWVSLPLRPPLNLDCEKSSLPKRGDQHVNLKLYAFSSRCASGDRGGFYARYVHHIERSGPFRFLRRIK